ncbi:collagen-flanked surface repeat-containing protein, partial [Ursidibacter sp. B-7004-1]
GDQGPTGDKGPTGDQGPTGEQGPQGESGENGKKATAAITDNGDGTHTITITNPDDTTTTTTVKDGKKGDKGDKGDPAKVIAGKNMLIKDAGTSEPNAVIVESTPHVEYESVTVGDVNINKDGIRVGDVKIATDGINAGSKKVTNVARGTAPTDAVNVAQLNESVGAVNSRINKTDKNLRAGVAGAMASAGLYHATLPGKSMVAAGMGTYKGESAVAIGYSRLSANGKVGIKASVNANTRGDFGAAASVGYQW